MWLIISGGILLMLVVILILVPLVVHRFLGPALQRRVSAVHPPDEVVFQDLRAMSLGLESKGPMQARGNGALVLTARELHFFQFTPATDLRIPLDTVTEVKTVRSHLGKSLARDLLHVSFTTADGGRDSMAWNATDVQAWITRLGESRNAAAG